MESKALESLGILPERRSRGWLKGILVVVVLAALACGGVVLFRWAGGILGSGDVEVTTSPASDSLFIREHLAVSKIKSIDCETTEVDGRMVATSRQYWFRLSVDEKWYLKRFAPQVKRYLGQIAPDAETRSVLLDTQKLAYSNDGADALRRGYGSRVERGDCYYWNELQDGTKSQRLSRGRNGRNGDVRQVLVLDRIANGGAETYGTVFALTDAQYAKFTDWVEQNVLRARPRITVVAMDGDRELLAENWDMNYLGSSAFYPVGDVYANDRYYVVSPWISVRDGVRCTFLGVNVEQREGLSDTISFKWSL